MLVEGYWVTDVSRCPSSLYLGRRRLNTANSLTYFEASLKVSTVLVTEILVTERVLFCFSKHLS